MKLNHYGKCPECGKSWDGGEISEGIRCHYSPPYRWSRLLGIEVVGGYDGISYWQCPDCGAKWSAFNGKKAK